MAQIEIFQPVHPSWTGEVSDFDGEYERVLTLSYDHREEKPRPRTLGASTSPRRCAICTRTAPDVSFKKKAHLVAACLGNRSLFSREDCDACNSESGRELEDDLGRMLLAQRTIGRVRSREGTAKLKGLKGLASAGGGPFDTALPIVLDPSDDAVQLTDDEKSSVELKLQAPSYRPMRAIRSLLRSMWLGFDSAARARYPWLLQLVRGERAVQKPEYFEFFVQGGAFGGVLLEAWQRRDSSTLQTSPLVFRLAFVNTLIVWCAPAQDTFQHIPSLLPPVASQRPSWAKRITLDGPDARQNSRKVTYTLAYEERTKPPADGTLAKTPPKSRYTTVRLEFEGAGGRVSLPETSLTKSNIDSPRPYFEVRGGSLTGWLSVQLGSKKNVTFRLEFAPHTGTPSDALATHRFLTALRDPGVFRVVNARTGAKVIEFQKDLSPAFQLTDIAQFMSDLDSINRSLGLALRVPTPPAKLPREITLIAAGLRHGRVAVKLDSPVPVVLPVRVARELLSGRSDNLTAVGGGWEVFGTTIDVGPRRIIIIGPSAHNPADLERSLEGKDEEEHVEMELACDRVIHEFENWLHPPGEPAKS